MNTLRKNALVLSVIVILFTSTSEVLAVCKGTFLNPVTDIYWAAMFPIRLAGITIAPGKDGLKTVDSSSSPVCVCPMPPPIFARVGLPVSFSEPANYSEVVVDPWCFPALGMSLPVPVSFLGTGMGTNSTHTQDGSPGFTFMNAHYFDFLPLKLLDLLVDGICLETKSADFDMLYMTEVDPLWQNPSLSFFIHPESILFSNYYSQLACSADSIAANMGYPLDVLFWCAGSMGGMYSLTGNTENEELTEASALLSARMLYKLGREGIMWDWTSYLCGPMPMPILIKSLFKTQIARPVVGKRTIPIGRSSMIWGIAKNPPTNKADNFLYMIFSRRNCCAL